MLAKRDCHVFVTSRFGELLLPHCLNWLLGRGKSMLLSSSSTKATTRIKSSSCDENPFIPIKEATSTTPPQPSTSPHAGTSRATVTTKPSRLLYRGSLALPDSEMLLEGISFITNASLSALSSSPIPLTLESQRN